MVSYPCFKSGTSKRKNSKFEFSSVKTYNESIIVVAMLLFGASFILGIDTNMKRFFINISRR